MQAIADAPAIDCCDVVSVSARKLDSRCVLHTQPACVYMCVWVRVDLSWSIIASPLVVRITNRHMFPSSTALTNVSLPTTTQEGMLCSMPFYFPIDKMVTGGVYIPFSDPKPAIDAQTGDDLPQAPVGIEVILVVNPNPSPCGAVVRSIG